MTQPTTEQAPAPEQQTGEQQETKTFTQEQVNAILAKAKRDSKPADYADLQRKAAEFDKLAEAQQTEAERAAKVQQEAISRAEKAEADALRLSVAFDKGLTPAQAKRLVGASREELEADADEILEHFPVKTDGRPRGDVDQGVRQTAPPTDPRSRDLAQVEADLAASRRKK